MTTDARATAILDRYLAGDLPANVALMQLLVQAAGEADALVRARLRTAADAREAERLHALLALSADHPGAAGTVRAVMAEADHDGTDPGRWAAIFDRLARRSPEAGVALYALGSPDLLRAATDEVVAWLRREGLIGPDRALLDIGCGYGRLSLALAADVAAATGLDISAEMIAEARRRAAGRAHLRFEAMSGRDLAGIPSKSVDLVLAADVFPYIVMAGPEAAPLMAAEAGRVLGAGGSLVVFNYSYRGDDARDGAEFREASGRAGLVPGRDGTRELALWDARIFTARKPA